MDYYDFLDQASVGKSYDWLSLNINLSFNKSEIDIDAIVRKEKPFGNSDNERLFIHEYVHYLQNFFCSWGGLSFSELILGLNKLGASSLNELFQVSLPLKLVERENAPLWNSGIYHYNKYGVMIDSDKGKIIYESLVAYPNFLLKELSNNKLIINNGRISYEINNKTIREHMAELCSLLFLNYSDEQIHEKFLGSKALCSSPQLLDKEPMYWIMFEYFYGFKFDKIAEGLVLLCNAALCSTVPVSTIIRFFQFLEEHNPRTKSTDLYQIVSGFLGMPTELLSFSYSYYSVIKQIINNLALCSKHFDHDFYKFTSVIFTNLLSNISKTYSGKLIFQNPISFRNKNTWIQLLEKTGTPIIRYKDKSPVISTPNPELIESLTYFLGVMKVLDSLQYNPKYGCPFHTEFNICKASFKDNDKCIHDPLSVKNPIKDGKECLYQNAIELIGLKGRL
jgi:hypothetical protein